MFSSSKILAPASVFIRIREVPDFDAISGSRLFTRQKSPMIMSLRERPSFAGHSKQEGRRVMSWRNACM